jgi:hypothetical protein
MTASEDVDSFLIYGAYGEAMHRFQVLELSLWGLLTRSIKTGTTLEQASLKLDKWDGTTFGQIVRGIRTQSHWPHGLLERLLEAVEVRNYLSHHFLREFFMAVQSGPNNERAVQQLASLSDWVEELENDLECHLRSVGITGPEDLDSATIAEIEQLRPKEWHWI